MSTGKFTRWLIQAVFWSIITAVFIWIPEWQRLPTREFIRTSVILSFEVLTIAVVIYVLFPLFFSKGHKALFFLAGFILLLVLGYVLVQYFPSRQLLNQMGPSVPTRPPTIGPHEPRPPRGAGNFVVYFTAIFPLFVSMAIAAFWEIWEAVQAKERAVLHLEKQHSESELKFLKSQMNPHFLLNALNNIYTLSILDSKQTSENIMRLAEIMRYVLFEGQQAQVALEKEWQYIRDYIALLDLKREGGVNVTADLPEVSSAVQIPPMLLIAFVENAAKHGNALFDPAGYIHISGRIAGSRLHFRVENSMSAEPVSKDETSGIGLTNVRSRLDIIYGQDYDLEIQDGETTFVVRLSLPLE